MTETSDQATRRRWITLAELVAVAGLLIGALTLYLNWADRRDAAAAKAGEQASAARDKARFVLRGEVAAGNRSIMLVRDEDHALRDVRVDFPTAFGIGAQDAVGHSIETEWFAEPLRRLTDGGADARSGRLPVLVTYTYLVDDAPLTRRAIYDIIWNTSGRFLRGRAVAVTDFRLREPGGSVTRLDALWAREAAQTARE